MPALAGRGSRGGLHCVELLNLNPLPDLVELVGTKSPTARAASGGSALLRACARIPEKNCLDVSRDISSRFGRFLRPPPLESHPVDFAGSVWFLVLLVVRNGTEPIVILLI